MPHTAPNIPPAKKRIFIAVTLLLPVIALLLLEAFLRIANYGPDLSLCTKTTVRGVDYYAMNGSVRGRYFSTRFFGGKTEASNVTPEYFQMPKPQNTYRIFCLGGSTTAGYPFGVLGSFSRFLQERLQRIFPERKIEVINFGITATNSFTVLDMARDAMDYSPDLIVVYDGHNEFYGALGIASRESAGRLRALGLAYMRMTHVKTFLLFNDVIDRLRSAFSSAADADLSGTAMERLAKGQTIPCESDVYKEGLAWYTENMEATIRTCEEHHVPVILSSQVSNLRDLPPFVPGFAESTSPENRTAFVREYDEGMHALNANDRRAALTHFGAALNLDTTRADAMYQYGRCLEQDGDFDGARRAYALARDHDELRFRQSTEFNEAVKQMRGSGVSVCDIEAHFELESPHGLIGRNLILEHLHPTLRGYFLMAKAYARTMREHGMIAPESEWSTHDTISDAALWDAKTVSPFDEAVGARRIDILTSSWPFVQGKAAGAIKSPSGQIELLAKDVVEKRLTWERGMVTAAEYYTSAGMVNEAASCYRSLIVLTPFNSSPYIRLGELLIGNGREDEGIRELKRSIDAEPTQYAFQLLGRMAYTRNDLDEALRMLEQSKQRAVSVGERTDASLGLALTYYRKGDLQRAISEAQYILTFNPSSEQARGMLQQIQHGEK